MFVVINERSGKVVGAWHSLDVAECRAAELNAEYPHGFGPYMVEFDEDLA